MGPARPIRFARHRMTARRSGSASQPEARYRGDCYRQTTEDLPLPEVISLESPVIILKTIAAGLTELSCQPQEADDLDGVYRAECAKEAHVPGDTRVPREIDSLSIELRGFSA